MNHTTEQCHGLNHLFDNNQAWVKTVMTEDPLFFERLSHLQTPEILWIGCSDSRVPANQITGLAPGEVFVHRNIANVVVHTDLNALSVIEFAVNLLKVKHIIVCGHYGCSGVGAALNNLRTGSLVDNWLRHVQDVRDMHGAYLGNIVASMQHAALCEFNVVEQVRHVAQTTAVKDAWEQGRSLTVHGFVYGIHNGILHNLNASVKDTAHLDATLTAAINAITINHLQKN